MKKLLSPTWLVLASFAMSWAWLLPNHTLPWTAFHSDAWTGIIFLVIASYLLFKNKYRSDWHVLSICAAIVTCIPILQYILGQISQFGIAWINAIYVLGFLFSLLIGAIWEKNHPNQCGDFIFLSITIASVISIGIQLNQFFDLEGFGPWILHSSSTRQFANMAQPNQLASLFLLGFLGCGWGYWRKLISAPTAIGIAAVFLVGIAITQSRTSWINIFLLVFASIIWRNVLPSRGYLLAMIGLACIYAFFVLGLPYINQTLSGDLPIGYRSASGDLRWSAWTMFISAILLHPWFGYGWGQIGHAQFASIDSHFILGGNFLQSHNIFIDLILWNGIPIGAGISAIVIWWLMRSFISIKTYTQLLLVCFIAVIGVHAMLEYPLHYAYFLFPFGLVIGCLNTSLGFKSIKFNSKLPVAAIFILATCALFITIRDYFRIEDSFYGLRFEQKNIESKYPRHPPDVIALTQWRDYIIYARLEPHSGMTPEELSWSRNLVSTTPSPFVIFRFASMLALNNYPDESAEWLKRLCLTSSPEHCDTFKQEWKTQGALHPEISAIRWSN